MQVTDDKTVGGTKKSLRDKKKRNNPCWLNFDVNLLIWRHSHCDENKPGVMDRWYNGILQGWTNVGGAAVSHSLTSGQCTLCVCAFMAVLSIMETEGVRH